MNMSISEELIPNANDRIICVKVGKITREIFYEMVRKYWAVKISRAKIATHVLAIVEGHVAAVYVPEEWRYTDNSQYKGRCEFVGKEDANSEYIGKSVASYYGKSQNPVKYINM
jgi:hypothetical protein